MINLAFADARFRQAGFAVVVGGSGEDEADKGDGDDEDVGGIGVVDSPEGGGGAAAEEDALIVVELTVVGTGAAVADGHVTFGNIWMSRRAAPPGRFCCAYSTGRPWAPTIPSSS